MQQLRQDLNSGQRVSHCDTCWRDEAAGKSSLRQEYNKRLAPHTDLRAIYHNTTGITDQLPRAFDLNLGNLCNFKCVMCTPEYSSRIAAERKQHAQSFVGLDFQPVAQVDLDWYQSPQFRDMFAQAITNVRILELKGGEPLLIDDVVRTIENVENKQQCVISINTNGSVPLTDEFVNLLSEFQRIWLNVSVDGILGHGEYVRYGSDWPTVHACIQRGSQLANCTFRLVTVLQFYSSLTLPYIVDYAIKHDLDVEVLNCRHPSFLRISAMLPHHHARLLGQIIQRCEQYPDLTWLHIMRGYLEAYSFDAVAHDQCAHYTQTIDSIRQNARSDIQALFKHE